MSPEQRAKRLAREMGRGAQNRTVEEDIARAIRAAENAALERAAKVASYSGMSDNPIYVPIPERIRSLKSRTPAPKPRGRRGK